MSAQPIDAFPYMQSYWMINQPMETSPALEAEYDTDVVIIGGGYAGMSTALGLLDRQPDLRVTIVEARHIGYGASGRNGGHIMNLLLRRGVTLFEDTPATSVESTQDGVTVQTPGGLVRAQRAVVTTNAYILQNSVSLEVSLPKTTILHNYVVATEQLSDEERRHRRSAHPIVARAEPHSVGGRGARQNRCAGGAVPIVMTRLERVFEPRNKTKPGRTKPSSRGFGLD